MILDDNAYHYCENVIRSPLPIVCRRRFMFVTLIVYLILQAYTCSKLSKWRQSKNQLKVNATEVNNSTSFNATYISQNLTDVTLSGNNLTVYFYDANTTNASTNSTTVNSTGYGVYTAENIPPLYGHAFALWIMMAALMILIVICRIRYQSMYSFAVMYTNSINMNTVRLCREKRLKYQQTGRKLDGFAENVLKTVLTLKEQTSVYKFFKTTWLFWKPTVSISSLTYPTVDCTLADYMFSRLYYEGSYQILGAVELIYEIMKGVDYLHYRNNYHLDLRPESVKLHCNGRKVYVKLTNFNFMKKSLDKKISSSSVGLKGFYRPLECSVEQKVDAEKCDIWGLGMIALELFTGGLYRIKSESGDWDEQRCEDLIRTFVECTSFSAYVDGTYGVVDMFTYARYNSTSAFEIRWNEDRVSFAIVTEYPYKHYNVCHTNFLYSIKCFVHRLLIFSPRRRITLPRAFEEPLIVNRKLSLRK